MLHNLKSNRVLDMKSLFWQVFLKKKVIVNLIIRNRKKVLFYLTSLHNMIKIILSMVFLLLCQWGTESNLF